VKLDPQIGLIIGSFADVGEHTLYVSAKNDSGESSAAEVHIKISLPPPQIYDPGAQTAVLGKAFELLLSTTNNPTKITGDQLPVGLDIVNKDGKWSITGKTWEDPPGLHHVTLTPENESGLGEPLHFDILVSDLPDWEKDYLGDYTVDSPFKADTSTPEDEKDFITIGRDNGALVVKNVPQDIDFNFKSKEYDLKITGLEVNQVTHEIFLKGKFVFEDDPINDPDSDPLKDIRACLQN